MWMRPFTFLGANILSRILSMTSGPVLAQAWQRVSAFSASMPSASSCCFRLAGLVLWYTAWVQRHRGKEHDTCTIKSKWNTCWKTTSSPGHWLWSSFHHCPVSWHRVSKDQLFTIISCVQSLHLRPPSSEQNFSDEALHSCLSLPFSQSNCLGIMHSNKIKQWSGQGGEQVCAKQYNHIIHYCATTLGTS